VVALSAAVVMLCIYYYINYDVIGTVETSFCRGQAFFIKSLSRSYSNLDVSASFIYFLTSILLYNAVFSLKIARAIYVTGSIDLNLVISSGA